MHYVDGGVDSGPILAQAVCPILAADSEQTLGKRLFEVSLPLTLATLYFLPQTSVGRADARPPYEFPFIASANFHFSQLLKFREKSAGATMP